MVSDSGVVYIASEIKRMGEALEESSSVQRMALGVLDQLDDGENKGRPYDQLACACFYIACIVQDRPLQLEDITDFSRCSMKSATSTYKHILDQIDLNVTPTEPEKFVRRYADEVGFEEDEIRRALDISVQAQSDPILMSRSDSSIASGILYATVLVERLDYDQEDIANATSVSLPTVRNNYPHVMDALDEEFSPEIYSPRTVEDAVTRLSAEFPDYPEEIADSTARITNQYLEEVRNSASVAGATAAGFVLVAEEAGLDVDKTKAAEAVGVDAGTVEGHCGQFVNTK